MGSLILMALIVFGVLFMIGIIAMLIKMYNKAVQGEALVRTGLGDVKVSFSGIFVVPVLHKLEVMDITLKTMEISRMGGDGLICKDNLRADIKVSFFIRVNKTVEDVVHVAQSIGCKRASQQEQLQMLFDAKFSEALKTVGKHFEFVQLYDSRSEFKERILAEIGTDLNGYILDDCAIDYLEQTDIKSLKEDNILDSEGIKKIIELTSAQKIKSNLVEREKEKIIKKQDVEAQETILELEKQLVEKKEKQRKEIESIKARENAEIEIVREEERKKSMQARILTDEEVGIAEQNKRRQILIAEKNKDKTEAIEIERVAQAKALEATEREKLVELARIAKEKEVELERKVIQDVIRERVAVERKTVEEQERIKDTQAFADADRRKTVAIKDAEKDAEEALVKEIKSAEAAKQASEHRAKQMLIDAEAEKTSALHKAQAIKTLADAEASQKAALGLSEAQVTEAKAKALEVQGEAEASVIEVKAEAEAKGIQVRSLAQAEADERLGLAAAKVDIEQGKAAALVIENKAVAEEKRGLAEAKVMNEKFKAEADGVRLKGEAMKQLDGVGKEHEEFKLQLEKEKAVELARIDIQREIAQSQAEVIAQALKSAKIDIVGGETMFFDQIVGSITKGKSLDKVVDNSHLLSNLKTVFLDNSDRGEFIERFRSFVAQFGFQSEDIKNMTISALLLKMMGNAGDEGIATSLKSMLDVAKTLNIADKKVGSFTIK